MLSTTSQKAKAYKASDSLYSKKQHKKWATALMVATAAAAVTDYGNPGHWHSSWLLHCYEVAGERSDAT
jgi:hypothetical protein